MTPDPTLAIGYPKKPRTRFLGIKAFKRANRHLGKDLNKAVKLYKQEIYKRVKESPGV